MDQELLVLSPHLSHVSVSLSKLVARKLIAVFHSKMLSRSQEEFACIANYI